MTTKIETQTEKHDASALSANYKSGLEPWCDENSELLILGTMPSDKSIEMNSYYCNSRNKFWEIIESLFHKTPEESKLSKKEYILSKKIALWDCLKSAKREGSLDSGIKQETEIPNDLNSFLNEHPSIKIIILNGIGKTTQCFDKFFAELRQNSKYTISSLPSTSGALPMPLEEKLSQWKTISDLLNLQKSE